MSYLVVTRQGEARMESSASMTDQRLSQLIGAENCVVLRVVASNGYKVMNVFEDGTESEVT